MAGCPLEGAAAPRAAPDDEAEPAGWLNATKAATSAAAMTTPAPNHGSARDRPEGALGTDRLVRRLPLMDVLSANSSTGGVPASKR